MISPARTRKSDTQPSEAGTGHSATRISGFQPARTLPSIPTLPSQARTRGLQGALAFLEPAVAAWTHADVLQWLNAHLVEPGFMKRPRFVREPGVTPVLLDARAEATSSLSAVLAKARGRVNTALLGLVGPVSDDRFLNAAIYNGRVRRTPTLAGAMWVPSPREIDFLGDIALSLFAADILTDRDFYRTHLGACDLCGKVGIFTATDGPRRCAQHGSRSSGPSRAR